MRILPSDFGTTTMPAHQSFGMSTTFNKSDHGFLCALNSFVKSGTFEYNFCTAHEMSFETLFYGLVNLVFFSELKALEDFVCASTHSEDQRINLYLLLFCVKASSNAIAFEAFDPSFPLHGFFESSLSGKGICDDAISSPNDS